MDSRFALICEKHHVNYHSELRIFIFIRDEEIIFRIRLLDVASFNN